MALAQSRHDALVAEAVTAQGGLVVTNRGEGDATFSVFATASSAIAAACALQTRLHTEKWPTAAPLRVRIAVHTGEAELRDGDYYGMAVNRCARIRSIGHGGQILISGAVAELVRDVVSAMGAELRSLGIHRLKDLAEPEHIYQIVHPDLPSNFQPLHSLEALPNNLPMQHTRFVGRERELAQVTRLLREIRLLTLTGTGGTGKTRMALQAAADVLESFPDGVWVVALEALSDPALLPQVIARALGVRGRRGASIGDTLIEHLRRRMLLLVLDNAEHLIVATADFVAAVLSLCPDVRLLVTSREPLHLPGETLWPVQPLALPDTEHLPPPERFAMYEAVQLFVDRASAAHPGFAVTNENAPAIAEICHRLDGIPLALELAAARVKVLAVEQIAERLHDRFRLLMGQSRTALPRHQTLRGAMDWSYDLLSPVEQALWRRLSVFTGSFTLEAAEAVCADDGIEAWEVLDLLSHLVDKSVVVLVSGARVNRYRLLETVRQYGREKLLAAGEERALRIRYGEYYTALVEEARPHLDEVEARPWFDRIEAEMDHIRAALEWCRSEPASEAGLRLGAAMADFWYHRGLLQEGMGHLNGLLAIPGGEPDSLARARALHSAGNLARYQQDPDGAERFETQALAIFQRSGDGAGMAACLNNLGNIAAIRRDFTRAETRYREAIHIGETGGAETIASVAMSNLARIYIHQGRLHEADELVARMRSIVERVDFALTVRRVGILRSMLMARRGEYEGAQSLAEEMLALALRQGSTLNVMRTLVWLGTLRGERGHLPEMKAVLQAMLALAHDLQVGGGALLRMLTLAAMAAASDGRPDQAARLLGAAQQVAPFDDLIGLGDPDALCERMGAELRRSLDEEAFQAAWSAGAEMSHAELIQLALQAVSP